MATIKRKVGKPRQLNKKFWTMAVKNFASKFKKKEWEKCCEVTMFVELCSTDLKQAEIIATKILSETYDEDYD